VNPVDSEPMMSLDKFIEQTGLSAFTLWRYRKKGMLTTVNICGRQYVLRAEIARFSQRGAAEEFAKLPNHPRKSSMLTRI
jgi:predicted site-specific integrase-resolvase